MKSFLSKTILLAFLLSVIYTDEVPPEGSLTTVLNEDNFYSSIKASGKPMFILFYAPWCGHCKRIKPDWFSLGEHVKETHEIGMVDWALCGRFSVQGFPTIKLVHPDGNTYDYAGARSTEAWKTFLGGEYEEQATANPTPPPPTMVQKALTKTEAFIKQYPQQFLIGLLVVMLIPFLMVCYMCMGGTDDDDQFQQPDINDDDDESEEEQNLVDDGDQQDDTKPKRD